MIFLWIFEKNITQRLLEDYYSAIYRSIIKHLSDIFSVFIGKINESIRAEDVGGVILRRYLQSKLICCRLYLWMTNWMNNKNMTQAFQICFAGCLERKSSIRITLKILLWTTTSGRIIAQTISSAWFNPSFFAESDCKKYHSDVLVEVIFAVNKLPAAALERADWEIRSHKFGRISGKWFRSLTRKTVVFMEARYFRQSFRTHEAPGVRPSEVTCLWKTRFIPITVPRRSPAAAAMSSRPAPPRETSPSKFALRATLSTLASRNWWIPPAASISSVRNTQMLRRPRPSDLWSAEEFLKKSASPLWGTRFFLGETSADSTRRREKEQSFKKGRNARQSLSGEAWSQTKVRSVLFRRKLLLHQ